MKHKIREKILAHRESMSLEDAEQKSQNIISRLKNDPDYKKAKTVMFYISKGNEVNTHGLIREAIKAKKVIVPKVQGDTLLCCHITDLDNMNLSCYGVPEPENTDICDISNFDLVIVPGVAFDMKRHRIGYGKGYYDGLLKNAKCMKIGLAYDSQIVENIPIDKWDIQLDKIITESKII